LVPTVGGGEKKGRIAAKSKEVSAGEGPGKLFWKRNLFDGKKIGPTQSVVPFGKKAKRKENTLQGNCT